MSNNLTSYNATTRVHTHESTPQLHADVGSPLPSPPQLMTRNRACETGESVSHRSIMRRTSHALPHAPAPRAPSILSSPGASQPLRASRMRPLPPDPRSTCGDHARSSPEERRLSLHMPFACAHAHPCPHDSSSLQLAPSHKPRPSLRLTCTVRTQKALAEESDASGSTTRLRSLAPASRVLQGQLASVQSSTPPRRGPASHAAVGSSRCTQT